MHGAQRIILNEDEAVAAAYSFMYIELQHNPEDWLEGHHPKEAKRLADMAIQHVTAPQVTHDRIYNKAYGYMIDHRSG